VAAQAGVTAWRRSTLAATGWIWLNLAGALAGHGLYARLPSAIPPPVAWTASPADALHEVLIPLLRSGLPAVGAIWALAAAVLPRLLRSRSPGARAMMAVSWAGLMLVLSVLAIAATGSAQDLRILPGELFGALCAAAIAAFPGLLSGGGSGGYASGLGPELP
jgi:hypothetical protein